MTYTTPSQALQTLRDTLRTTQSDVESLINHLSTCLDVLYQVQARNSPGPSSSNSEPVRKAIQRFLPSIQIHLITQTVPNYLHALDKAQEEVLRSFFAPRRNAEGIQISRWIALTSYHTLPPFLNAQATPESTSELPIPSRAFLLNTLDRLVGDYGVEEIYWAVWSDTSSEEKGRLGPEDLTWEEVTRSLVGVPAKAANAVGRWTSDGWVGEIPERLYPKVYFDGLIVELENLMYELSLSSTPGFTDRVRLLIERLAALGLLKAPPTTQHSRQPSFLSALLPPLLAHLHPPASSPLPAYPATFLPSIFLPLPTSTLSAFVSSLIQHLSARIEAVSLEQPRPDEGIKRAVEVFGLIVGRAEVGGEAWGAVMRAISGQRSLSSPTNVQEHVIARVVCGWVRSGGSAEARELVEVVTRVWTDPKSIKFSMYSQLYHMTHMLLLSLSLFRQYDPFLVQLSHRAEFLIAIQSFLSHPDPKVRRLGMLVAEILSELTIVEDPRAHAQTDEEELAELQAGFDAQEGEKPVRNPKASRRLKFGEGMWDGEGEGREECRRLRRCVRVNDLDILLADDPSGKIWLLGWDQVHVPTPSAPSHTIPTRSRGRTVEPTPRPAKAKAAPKIIMLDEDQQADPLEGYAPESPSSSRSPSPTPSYLEEVAADPSLALDSSQNKKASRPVYVQQLIMLLKEKEKPDYIEMGLKWGEGLVRAKRSFGTELSENAVNLAMVTISLNNPYNLDNFEDNRQGLTNALVASAPRQTAPYLIEQYFEGQYSLQQKSVLLTSLAMGARELSGLGVSQPINTNRRLDFPTKMLPPDLHQKYIGPNDIPDNRYTNQLEDAVSGVRDLMLSKSARRGEETIPELARDKKLRVGPKRTSKVAEVGTMADRQMISTGSRDSQIPIMPFKDVAAEYFIMPLINRFWQYFQDSSTREARAISTGERYRGAGTGMILSALALEKMLMTLSLLIHAARHSAVFLSVLAPEAIELGVTIGARHLPSPSNNPLITDMDTAGMDEGSKTEAQVLAAALELVLVSLDVSVELDKGRTLAMDKAELVLAAGEWASGVFEVESRGGEVSSGQGGMREGRVKATSAGVVVKIAEIGERWVSVGGRMR